jgi:hypothetical protein
MYGPDLRTLNLIDEVERRPICQQCGNKVDLAMSATMVTYRCGCNATKKEVTLGKPAAEFDAVYVHPATVFGEIPV